MTEAVTVDAPRRLRRRLLPRWIMAWPALAWWTFFFVIPLLWILVYSLGAKPAADVAGPVSLETLSFRNYGEAISEIFFNIFLITIRTAGLGTILCALIGFPVAYALAVHVPAKWRSLLIFLLILPFWTSFLLRTFAWRIILAPQGTLSDILQTVGFISRRLLILDTNAAVQLGIIYNYMPVMIMPIYVALERIDSSLTKASMDLGAGPVRTFFQVTLPLTAPGLFGGLLLTFILAAGDYVVPTILGGTKGLMVGNLVATQILASQNLPLGSAMAVMLIALLALIVMGVAVALWVVRRLIAAFRGAAL